MRSSLPPLVDTVATRLTLHALAEHVLAEQQRVAIGTIRLRVVENGFSTRWFSADGQPPRRIRVEGTELIRESESGVSQTREPIAGEIDPRAADVLYAWWGSATPC